MVRKYIDVICLNDKRGVVKPLYIIWDENRKIPIVKIKEVCLRSNTRAGGTGVRYTCLFSNERIRHLYFDEGKWFVEQDDHMV
ncbi:MAG: hypothetical protein Q4D13_04320 [Erysipelotrichaceae bacterium]|nr:hypothetical protein [Erysipelotrichaceae bacterium]